MSRCTNPFRAPHGLVARAGAMSQWTKPIPSERAGLVLAQVP